MNHLPPVRPGTNHSFTVLLNNFGSIDEMVYNQPSSAGRRLKLLYTHNAYSQFIDIRQSINAYEI